MSIENSGMGIPPSGIDTGHWILETFDFGSYASSSFSDVFSVSVEDGSVLHELLLDSSSSLESLVCSSSLKSDRILLEIGGAGYV